MSTGKRLAKRSILGTRVCAKASGDGLFYPGVIQATRTDNDNRGADNQVYCVLFDGNNTMGEYRSGDLIGPGFQHVTSLKLKTGQGVYVTHNGREVAGRVLKHRPNIDEVILSLAGDAGSSGEVKKRLEEVRLMESRKSARLQDHETNYSRLGRTNSIDIQNNSVGRKRRPSADDDVMDDCMAAMVLMSLSCSPKSPRLPENGVLASSWASGSSWLSSSGCSSHRESPPRTPPSPDPRYSTSGGGGKRSRCSSPTDDEGIEMAFPMEQDDTRQVESSCAVLYRCVFPGCSEEYQTCTEVEKHVRTQHLGRKDLSECDLRDHEEEFYYTEIEIQEQEPSSNNGNNNNKETEEDMEDKKSAFIFMSSPPTLSHLDMVRPPHEDPEYQKQLLIIQQNSPASPINIPELQPWQQSSYTGLMQVSPKKLMRLNNKISLIKGSSPMRKGLGNSSGARSESRKCRKIYGMENREMWCTQCKWKKACTRFSE